MFQENAPNTTVRDTAEQISSVRKGFNYTTRDTETKLSGRRYI